MPGEDTPDKPSRPQSKERVELIQHSQFEHLLDDERKTYLEEQRKEREFEEQDLELADDMHESWVEDTKAAFEKNERRRRFLYYAAGVAVLVLLGITILVTVGGGEATPDPEDASPDAAGDADVEDSRAQDGDLTDQASPPETGSTDDADASDETSEDATRPTDADASDEASEDAPRRTDDTDAADESPNFDEDLVSGSVETLEFTIESQTCDNSTESGVVQVDCPLDLRIPFVEVDPAAGVHDLTFRIESEGGLGEEGSVSFEADGPPGLIQCVDDVVFGGPRCRTFATDGTFPSVEGAVFVPDPAQGTYTVGPFACDGTGGLSLAGLPIVNPQLFVRSGLDQNITSNIPLPTDGLCTALLGGN